MGCVTFKGERPNDVWFQSSKRSTIMLLLLPGGQIYDGSAYHRDGASAGLSSVRT